jgi:hypothetical protein
MNPEENKRAMRLLVSLFSGSTITQEQGALIREEFDALSYGPVIDAIKEHRRTHEHVIINSLIEGCRAAERGDSMKATVASSGEGSWFDVRRRQNPAYAGRCDIEVAVRVFWRFWQESPKTELYRKKLADECARILLTAGPSVEGGAMLNQGEAEQWAQVIFEPIDQIKASLEYLRDTVPAPFMPESVPAAATMARAG